MCVLTTCPENKPLRDLGGSRHESGTYTTYIKGCHACDDGHSITTYESDCQACGNRSWNPSGWPSGGPGLCTLSCSAGEGIWDVVDWSYPYCRPCNYQSTIFMGETGWSPYSSQGAAEAACTACGRYFITKNEGTYCVHWGSGGCEEWRTKITFICSLTPCPTCGDNYGCPENTFPVSKYGREDFVQCRSCDEPLLLGEDSWGCPACATGKRNNDSDYYNCSLKTCAAGTYNPNSEYNTPPCDDCPADLSSMTTAALCSSCGRWYNNTCCPAFSALTTSSACATCGGYWENGVCLGDCPAELNTLTTDEACWLCGGLWEDGACGCPEWDALLSAAPCEHCGGYWFNGACQGQCPAGGAYDSSVVSQTLCANCGFGWNGDYCCPAAASLDNQLACLRCGYEWQDYSGCSDVCPSPPFWYKLYTEWGCERCGGYWSNTCWEVCPSDLYDFAGLSATSCARCDGNLLEGPTCCPTGTALNMVPNEWCDFCGGTWDSGAGVCGP